MTQPHNQIGPYTLLNKLGRGAFGVVWLAEKHTAITTTRVAIKLPNEEVVDLEAVRREADVWVEASGHPNVLPIIDADIYDGQVIIVSEYAPDGSLTKWLKQHDGKAPSFDAAVKMTDGILAGLEHLHERKIIHRDLKPDNILLQRGTPRLADFGIARVLKYANSKTAATGTPWYMAPEAYSGKRSAQTDLWAAGVLLYQLLTGSLPFPQEDPPALMYAILTQEPEPISFLVPKQLRDVIAKVLNKDPAQRYQSAAEMREALHSEVRKLDPSTPREKRVEPQPTIIAVQPELPPPAPVSSIQMQQLDGTLRVPFAAAGLVQPPHRREASEPQAPQRKSHRLWWLMGAGAAALLLMIGIGLTVFIIIGRNSDPANQEQILSKKVLPSVAAAAAEEAKGHGEKGQAYLYRSEPAPAEAEYKQAVQLEPNNPLWHAKLASSLAGQNKLEEAKSEAHEAGRLAQEALQTEPNNSAYHYCLAAELSAQEKYKEAEAEYREAIRLNPNDVGSLNNLGLTLNVQKKYKEAEAAYRDAIRLNPNFVGGHTNLGTLLLSQKRYKEAEAEYREAIRLNPNRAGGHTNLGDFLLNQKKYKEAEAEYREALRLDPNDATSHDNLGFALYSQERYKEAETEYRTLTRLDPKNSVAQYNVGVVLERQKKNEEAEAAYREAIRLNPNDPKGHIALGNALKKQNRDEEAEAEYATARRLKKK